MPRFHGWCFHAVPRPMFALGLRIHNMCPEPGKMECFNISCLGERNPAPESSVQSIVGPTTTWPQALTRAVDCVGSGVSWLSATEQGGLLSSLMITPSLVKLQVTDARSWYHHPHLSWQRQLCVTKISLSNTNIRSAQRQGALGKETRRAITWLVLSWEVGLTI